MGRRKIEIQPITNERNRAVTFLKRKQGLFKKAYELGVLCSVDVAVIIFERRQGSEKLFQYSSGDAQAIINKQARFEGERSLQGPADFNGSAPGGKGGAANDDDEDDEGDGEADELAAQPQPATPASSSAPATSAPTKSKGKAKAPAPATSASRTTIKTESPTVTISNEEHPPPSPTASSTPSPPSAAHRASTSSAPRDTERTHRSKDKDRTEAPRARSRSPGPPRGTSYPSKRPRLSPPPSGYPFRMDLDLSTLPPPMSLGLGMSIPPYYHPHAHHPHRPYPPPPPPGAQHYAPPYPYTPDAYHLPRISHPQGPSRRTKRSAEEILADCWNGIPSANQAAELASLLEPPDPNEPLDFDWPVSTPHSYGTSGFGSGGGGGGGRVDDPTGWLELLGGLDPPMRSTGGSGREMPRASGSGGGGGAKRARAEESGEE